MRKTLYKKVDKRPTIRCCIQTFNVLLYKYYCSRLRITVNPMKILQVLLVIIETFIFIVWLFLLYKIKWLFSCQSEGHGACGVLILIPPLTIVIFILVSLPSLIIHRISKDRIKKISSDQVPPLNVLTNWRQIKILSLITFWLGLLPALLVMMLFFVYGYLGEVMREVSQIFNF